MLFRPWVLWAAVRRNREQIVHFHDPEIIPAALLLHWQGVTVVYDAHEDVPRQILSKRWLPKGSHRLVARLFEALENFGARRLAARSEASSVGKEVVMTGRYRGWLDT